MVLSTVATGTRCSFYPKLIINIRDDVFSLQFSDNLTRFIDVSPLCQFAPWTFRPKTFRPW